VSCPHSNTTQLQHLISTDEEEADRLGVLATEQMRLEARVPRKASGLLKGF